LDLCFPNAYIDVFVFPNRELYEMIFKLEVYGIDKIGYSLC
jgi:hypothetical protein